jgi:uncharacterized protein
MVITAHIDTQKIPLHPGYVQAPRDWYNLQTEQRRIKMDTNTQMLEHALLDAVIANNAIDVKSLLEQGANPNYYEDDAKFNALHYAVMYNAEAVVDLLVTGGADLNARTDEENFTALQIAIARKNETLTAKLKQFETMSSLADTAAH